MSDTVKVGGMTLTRDEARKAGLLPEQRLARHRRSLQTLQDSGHGETRTAAAVRDAVQRLEADGVQA